MEWHAVLRRDGPVVEIFVVRRECCVRRDILVTSEFGDCSLGITRKVVKMMGKDVAGC